MAQLVKAKKAENIPVLSGRLVYKCYVLFAGYIKKHLKFMDRYNSIEDRKMVRRFVNIYLRPDGVFMIRLLSKNTNSIIVSELVAQLWDQYLKKPDHGQPPIHIYKISFTIRDLGINETSQNLLQQQPGSNATCRYTQFHARNHMTLSDHFMPFLWNRMES